MAVAASLPVVLVPVGTDDEALDACLAALEVGTPAGTRVWLADNIHAGPRGLELIRRWLDDTALQADFSRRRQRVGEAAHLAEMIAACGDADVIVLAPDTVPAPGWFDQLVACLAHDAAIGSASTWCNAGETASWPRVGDVNAVPERLPDVARAAAALPRVYPELPNAVAHAVILRGSARRRAGALDGESYGSWYASLVDYSLRLAGLGWRNALCANAFVARVHEAGPAEGDNDVLAVRWPGWHKRLADFLMHDPLRSLRQDLQRRVQEEARDGAQQELFRQATASTVADGNPGVPVEAGQVNGQAGS
ncbi:MAG: glycosyltransferase [Pseudoxanthomonas suwonensis]|nr:glycosyltransferase [Pseudoxanthomonas suwonensis]